jgi:hypothetical protein
LEIAKVSGQLVVIEPLGLIVYEFHMVTDLPDHPGHISCSQPWQFRCGHGKPAIVHFNVAGRNHKKDAFSGSDAVELRRETFALFEFPGIKGNALLVEGDVLSGR